MDLVKSFRKENILDFCTVELNYNYFSKQKWFCRVWHKDWLNRIIQDKKEYGEGFGASKFEAYRNAVINIETIKPK